MKFIVEKTAVLSFLALKIIVFSTLIFVITGCQGTDNKKLTSELKSTVTTYNLSPSPISPVSTQTASPTSSPITTPAPTPTPIPTPSTLKPTVLPAPTLTSDLKNETPTRNLLSPTPIVKDQEVNVSCSLDSEALVIYCEITGSKVGQNYKWTSNATTRWETGLMWEFSLGETAIPDITEVVIEICDDIVCRDLHTELETSHLVNKVALVDVTYGESQSTKPSSDKPDSNTEKSIYNPLAPSSVMRKYPVWAKHCTNSGPVMFSYSPMRFEDINHLSPYGSVVGAHITPIDHMYFDPKDKSLGKDIYEVKAIQDAVIYEINVRDISTDTNEAKKWRDWRLDMAHTCTFASYFDLLTSVVPEIEEKWAETLAPGAQGKFDGVEVKAGQVIGYVGGQSLDFGVYDWEVSLPGLINPEAYASREPWKIHTVDPFQYFPKEIRDGLLNKMIRIVEPRAGTIDYDVGGTLSGNWFQQGTDWYNGINQEKYWEGHLSIAPHQIDPNLWRIGIGFLETNNNNFIIYGENSPLDIAVDSGPVSYELRKYKVYIPSKPQKKWWIEPHVEGEIYGVYLFPDTVGTVLLNLEEKALLRLEVFMGESKDQIDGFTQNARLYER